MWRASVLTIFPEMFPGPLGVSLAGKALGTGIWSLDTHDIRNAATDKHRTVDDTPAGGGPGMVMKADVLARALDTVPHDHRPRLLMSPRGTPLTQARAANLAAGLGVVIVCGRFEGVDERLIKARKLEEVSLGDFVLSGGEPAAIALLDACVRLLPGVLGKEASIDDESFADGLLGIPAIHPAPGVRGRADPGRAHVRRPRQGRRLAAGGGRTADPRAPAGPVGGLSGPKSGQKRAKNARVTSHNLWSRSSPTHSDQTRPRAGCWRCRRRLEAMNIIQQLDQEQVEKLSAGREIPDFQPGDTVLVNVKVVEGDKTRVQAYEGVCIGRSGRGINENFTVRKISYGEGVERVFPLHAPMIDSIKVVRRGKVRRAKLYYLRGLRGKKARIEAQATGGPEAAAEGRKPAEAEAK